MTPARAAEPMAAPPAPGGDEAFGVVYTEHSRQVFYLALRMLGDETMAEDATHDVFLKAWKNLDSFRGDANIRTWLYRITINHCQNLSGSWHRRTMVNNVDDVVWDNSAAAEPTPLRVLETKELGQRIHATMAKLPEEYRLMLLLVADEKLSYDEVAELTGQTADAVRGKLHRARKAFIQFFQKTA